MLATGSFGGLSSLTLPLVVMLRTIDALVPLTVSRDLRRQAYVVRCNYLRACSIEWFVSQSGLLLRVWCKKDGGQSAKMSGDDDLIVFSFCAISDR